MAVGNPSVKHWSNLAERGHLLGLRMVLACYRCFGERAAQWLLYPIVGYFFITGHKARAASLDYLRRINAHGAYRGTGKPEPGWRESYRHMLAFGQSGLDKMAAWSGSLGLNRFDFPNRSELLNLSASGRGAVLIGSHLGNLEMSRAFGVIEYKAKINAVLYTKHAHRFNTLLKQANPEFDVNFIQISHIGPETSILLKEKIDRGEFVVIVGDRTPPGEGVSSRVSLVEFLGEKAPFAQGPFILASLLECPVYLFFSLREGNVQRVYLERFAERIELPRKERLQRLQGYMKHYASRLEYYCLKAPEQWFNFYDFWRQNAVSISDKD